MSIVEFLLARIGEDEAVARAAGGEYWYKFNSQHFRFHRVEPDPDDDYWRIDSPKVLISYHVTSEGVADHMCNQSPERVLAECEAKRRIVADLTDDLSTCSEERQPTDKPGVYNVVTVWQPRWYNPSDATLAFLAGAYRDHPDYDAVRWSTA